MDHLQPIRDALEATLAEREETNKAIAGGLDALKGLRAQRDEQTRIIENLRNALGLRADGTRRKAREEAQKNAA